MRHILLQQSALESVNEGPVISLEEEVVLIDEANADAAAIATEITEAERGVEVVDALEDLAVIADQIEEPTPAEAMMIENTAAMAVAGTDITPEEVIAPLEVIPVDEQGVEITDPVIVEQVATESYKGKVRISMEGVVDKIRAKAKQIWETILKFIKDIWAKLEGFFYKIFGTIPRMRRSVEDLQKKVAEAKGYTASGEKLKLTSGIAGLSVNGNAVADEAGLKSAVGNMVTACEFVFGEYQDKLVKRGEAAAVAIKAFDPTKSEESAGKVRDALVSNGLATVPSASGKDTSRFPGFETSYGAHLLGNVVLVSKKYVGEKSKGATVLGALDHLRSERVELVASKEGGVKTAEAVEMDVLSLAAMEAVLKDALAMLKAMEEFNRGPKSKAVQKARKDLEAASNTAEAEMGKLKDGDVGSQAAVPNFRAVLNFNTAFTRWAQSPAVGMAQHSRGSINAMMYLVSKSLSQYKAAK